ncbi:MAG TPA: S8 family serine peptidase [Bacteroidota bacterium]
MRLRYILFNLLLFAFSSFAPAQSPRGFASSDSIYQRTNDPGEAVSPSDESVLFQTGTASGAPTIRSFKPGSKVISLAKGDSTLQTFGISSDDMVNVIVEFTAPPISILHNLREKFPAPRLQSAVSSIQGNHDQFRSDFQRITSSPPQKSRSTFADHTSTIRYEYSTALNGVALTAPRWALDVIRKLPYVKTISEDGTVTAFDDSSNALIEAPQLWSTYGLHADSIDIGIIDTGIDYLHEALGAGPIPNGKVVGGYDFVNNDNDPMDDNGHGTHVAGIAAGYGPPPLNLRGVAFGAHLWAFKCLNESGQGLFSQIIAGVNLALDPDNNPSTPTPISVLNLSIGGSGNPNDALSHAIDNATTGGVVCAVAAGNSGSGYYTINSPGCARKALTVGAVNNTDVIAFFSSRGPSSLLFAIKPDLLAPGYPINSAKLGGGYLLESGTSMATPHVAGAAALMRELHPAWTAEEIKASLMNTAHDDSYDVWTQGTGRMDVFHAAQESVVVSPATLSFGSDITTLNNWTVKETLQIYNSTTLPEIFQLSLQSATPGGVSISLSPSTVAVPIDDSASVVVTLTVDNTLYPYPTSYPPAYINKVIVQSTLTSEHLTVPCAFVKSPIFNLSFDVPPTLVIIHNNRDTAFFSVAFSNLIGTGLSLLVPVDTYDVATYFYVDSQMVITEGVYVGGFTTVSIHSTDATHLLTLRMLDVNGNEITRKRTELESIVSRRSRFGVSLFGPQNHTRRYISNLSTNYIYELSAIPEFFNGQNYIYEFPYVVSNGVSTDLTVQNNPSDFKRVDYRFKVPSATNKLYLSSIFSSPSFGLGTTVGTLSPPFNLAAYYLPTPREENFPYATHWLTRNTLDIINNLLHRTGYSSISQPDTMKFTWSTTGYYSGSSQFVSNRNKFQDALGITAPMWGGKVINLGTQFDVQVATDSYFINALGDRTAGPFTYSLSTNGVPLDSGVIQNMPRYHLDTLLTVPGGPYEFNVFFNQFNVGARQAIAAARMKGNSNNQGTILPRFKKLQFLRNGELPDSLPVNQLAVVPKADQGLDSVGVWYRRSSNPVWIPLSLSTHDSTYLAALPETLSVGYYSARVRITDNASNVMDYDLEPGFAIPGTLVDKTDLVYDTIHVGCRQTKTISIQNLRFLGDVHVQSIVSDDSDFVLPGGSSAFITASESLNVAVTFSPLTEGEKHGNIIFTIDGIATPETVHVSGVGGGPGSEINVSATLGTRWQLISVPVDAYCRYVMPVLFGFRGTYLIKDTLNPGEGYWKYLGDTMFIFTGQPITTDTIQAYQGWNLIGAISYGVPTVTLSSIPDGMISSRVFGYTAEGYFKPDSILPGHGYWVKVGANCKLVLTRQPEGALPKPAQADQLAGASSITITDAAGRSRSLYFGHKSGFPADQRIFELPPNPPDGAFDVRYATNRECEIIGDREARTLPIRILSAEYPITVRWDVNSGDVLAVLNISGQKIHLGQSGHTVVNSPADTLMLKISGESRIPKTFALDPNHPNPFNPQTVVPYQLPVDSRVDLRIFNALGEEVVTLAHGEEPAGFKSATWNATNVATGVYFCRLQAVSLADPARTFTKVQKLVLIR